MIEIGSNQTIRQKYIELNKSFRNRFVYQFGRGGGFCAEFVGLVKSMLQCLDQRIQFCLGQNKIAKGLSISEGWNDYFLPIFPEVKGILLQSLNRPMFPFNRRFPIMRFTASFTLDKIYKNHYFMFDSLGSLPGRLKVPELGIDLEYWDACKALIELIWNFRAEVRDKLQQRLTNLNLPDRYVAVHIRRGDKIKESQYVPIAKYIKAFGVLPQMPSYIYLATDDYRTLEEMKAQLPNYIQVISGIVDSKRGYDQTTFNEKSPIERWEEIVLLLFELEIMKRAEYFIGAVPSNVFYLVRMQRAAKNLIDVSTL